MSESRPDDGEPGAPAENPLDRQREMMAILSQETRHDVVQALLGHPHHLASEDELDYLVHDKSKGAVQDAIERLVEANILALYEHPPNESRRDYPHNFYGFTEYGIEVLDGFNYLKGVPLARALHEKTRLSGKVERHESAARPDLPTAVVEALEFEGDDTTTPDEAATTADRSR